MAKKKKVKRRGTHIRAWRKHRHLTQDQLAERLGLTQATVARIERGDIAYTQPVLEALANALNCEPWDLIWRPPEAADGLREVLEGMNEEDQRRALAVVKALKGERAA